MSKELSKIISEAINASASRQHIKEEVKVPREIRRLDPDAYHVGSTPAGHHVFAVGETDRGESWSYAVRHPDKSISTHTVDSTELPSKVELSNKQSWHDVDTLDPAVRDIIHDDLKTNLG